MIKSEAEDSSFEEEIPSNPKHADHPNEQSVMAVWDEWLKDRLKWIGVHQKERR
jgi:hypothetical protein